jgi:hypothetical protein
MNIKTNTMKFLQNQIKTKKDIAYYIADLYDNNMMYHFDDDAEDILSNESGFSDQAFTDEQCKLLNERRDEMLAIDYDYVFECACSLLEDNN